MSAPVAIIPARAGSKRIPHKNIKDFAGLPMIARSIEAAREAELFGRILVSTDSDLIAEVAVRHGAECAFRRPPELADDTTATAPVLEHALRWLVEQGVRPTHACCLYATAPFVRAGDLREGHRLLIEHACGSVFPVTSFGFPIFRALRVAADGRVGMLWPEHRDVRSQDLPEAVHDAGQFYWIDVARFLAEPLLYCHDSRPLPLPRWRVQDIDTPEDWRRAELMHVALRATGG